MKEGHSKMDNLFYLELSMQGYLKDERNNVEDARIFFRFRTRMARLWENFKGGRLPQPFPVCKEVKSVDTQVHSFQCRLIQENVNIGGKYKDIFIGTTEKEVMKTVKNIIKYM